MKLFVFLPALAALLGGLGGCSFFYGERATVAGTLSLAPVTLDPVLAEDPGSQWVIAQLQRALTRVDAQGGVEGDLSDGWSTDVSGKRYVFVLRPAQWSDGVSVKAQDFVYAWRRHLKHKSAISASLSDIENPLGEGLRAASDTRLEVQLKKADARFPAKLSSPLLGPLREDVGHDKEAFSPLHLRCTGAYQPLSWKENELVLVANSYAPQAPAVYRVDLSFGTDKKHGLWIDVLSPKTPMLRDLSAP